jgi:type IV secretion system protein VirB9
MMSVGVSPMRCLIVTLSLLLASAPVLAQSVSEPVPGPSDPRIRFVTYNPDAVVRLIGHLGYQFVIEFGQGERIENVALGDAMAWQVTPNRRANLLFVKPVDTSVQTNMTVITSQRRYTFELVADPNRTPPPEALTFAVRFQYPADKAQTQAATPAAADPLQANPERINSAYSFKGSRRNVPSRVFDDGQVTYFQFGAQTQTPAIFVIGPDKKSESVVNYAVRGDYLVIEQVAAQFVLRQGKEVTRVFNDGFREPELGANAPRKR